MSDGPFGIPGPVGESDIKERQPPDVVRPLRAVAKGGGDVGCLAARAASEIERLRADTGSMLEALKAVVVIAEGGLVVECDSYAQRTMDMVRAAIAKATSP